VEFAVRGRQLLGQTAFGGNFETFIEPVFLAGARAGEENALAIRIPAEHAVHRAMISQAFGEAAGGGHNVDIGVAVVIAAETDLGAIWREAREGFLAAR